MYTVCWNKDGQDKWERLNWKEDVTNLVEDLLCSGLCKDDILIFSPEADNHVLDCNDVLDMDEHRTLIYLMD